MRPLGWLMLTSDSYEKPLTTRIPLALSDIFMLKKLAPPTNSLGNIVRTNI